MITKEKYALRPCASAHALVKKESKGEKMQCLQRKKSLHVVKIYENLIWQYWFKLFFQMLAPNLIYLIHKSHCCGAFFESFFFFAKPIIKSQIIKRFLILGKTRQFSFFLKIKIFILVGKIFSIPQFVVGIEWMNSRSCTKIYLLINCLSKMLLR